MDDREFDLMLEEELELLPLPDQEAAAVNPWEKAMGQIVWGLALTTITINHWYLNYLLPAVGMMLLLLGHRTLRQENKWFAWAWYLTAAESARMFITYTLQATRFELNTLLGWQLAWAALHMAELFCLWQGIRQVRRKAGQPDQAGAVAALMVWSGIILAVALLGGNGWVILLPLLVAYIAIFYNLGKLTRLLDGAGYCITAAPVRVPNWAVAGVYLTSLALCIGGCLFAFGHYPMDWQQVEDNWQGDTAAIRENLAELGFPADLLADLPEEELLRCQGATYVDWEEYSRSHTTWEVKGKEPEVLLVAVTLPEGRYRLFQAFRWTQDPSVRGMDCIELWPPDDGYGEIRWEDITGQLFCEMDGRTSSAPYHSLEEVRATYNSVFFGWTDQRGIYGAFSFPLGGENCRGYVAYDLGLEDSYWVNWPEGVVKDNHYAWLNYTHQKSWLNYPMTTGLDYRLGGGLRNRTFDRAQYQLKAWVRIDNRE